MDRGVTVASSKIERWQLRRGDHIYARRSSAANVYCHHGIYESDKKVIHFTNPSAQSSTGFSSSSAFSSSSYIFCWECRQAMHGGGVVSCCLDCFLEGDSLRLFAYSVPLWFYTASNVGMIVVNRARLTCHMADEDPPEAVLERANYLLRNGFGTYDALVNNCFDFAFYCKTGGTLVSPARAVMIGLNPEPVQNNPTCMIL
ncbi:protein LEAD-SENSITIVE 1-like [Miscanthus floridulus]|uniref:protein LEAD-SENSITIVE 1-like n=1 Tax=Miscanthus floridulus TaxID=154761 RepID=UPI0034590373